MQILKILHIKSNITSSIIIALYHILYILYYFINCDFSIINYYQPRWYEIRLKSELCKIRCISIPNYENDGKFRLWR